MSIYWIIDSIQNAKTVEALAVVERWINELTHHGDALASMALIKRCELIAQRYTNAE
jgi:hypothetical protein